MTLTEIEELFKKNNIPFELCEFENEKAYWHHIALFPYTKNAKSCKVIAMIIKSKNEQTNIELQFNEVNNIFFFEELFFGDYGYEMFDCAEDTLPSALIDSVFEVMKGNIKIITCNDLKGKHRLGDACFDLNDDDNFFGKQGFQKAMEHINKPKKFLSKLFKSKKQYEIYDWNTYQCIIK